MSHLFSGPQDLTFACRDLTFLGMSGQSGHISLSDVVTCRDFQFFPLQHPPADGGLTPLADFSKKHPRQVGRLLLGHSRPDVLALRPPQRNGAAVGRGAGERCQAKLGHLKPRT